MVVPAGQLALVESYMWVYYASIAFSGVSIIGACSLGDIKTYMDDHVDGLGNSGIHAICIELLSKHGSRCGAKTKCSKGLPTHVCCSRC